MHSPCRLTFTSRSTSSDANNHPSSTLNNYLSNYLSTALDTLNNYNKSHRADPSSKKEHPPRRDPKSTVMRALTKRSSQRGMTAML